MYFAGLCERGAARCMHAVFGILEWCFALLIVVEHSLEGAVHAVAGVAHCKGCCAFLWVLRALWRVLCLLWWVLHTVLGVLGIVQGVDCLFKCSCPLFGWGQACCSGCPTLV